jgi:gamma-glutamyltranspeptidase/glutathione hydrolase
VRVTTAAASDYTRVRLDRTQARSVVMSTRGVVASEHPLASQAGASVLAAGGHAVDAALAANAVMGVVAPMMNGVGGDLFALVCEADGTLHGLNASGWSSAALTPERLQRLGHASMPQSGPHAVTVPGAVAGWDALHRRFGRAGFASVLAPAIAIAREGFAVSELVAGEWQGSEAALQADAGASRTFLVDGRAPAAGTIFRNPDLAASYELIAASGGAAFYEGDLGARIVRTLKALGGAMTADDLAAFAAEWVAPLSTTYRDWTVYELPPNGQGFAALLMLNILEQFDVGSAGHNSADALHPLIEAKKLAYADMRRHLADPRHAPVPIEALLSKGYARHRASLVDPWRANPEVVAGDVPSRGSDTTYLCAADRHGNVVSLIQSNFANFGSGIVPEGTGFALQNRGGLFTLDPSHPNVLAPRKRPLHTIIPGFMRRDGVGIAFGIMGGWNQAQAHVQFVSNVVDHGLNIQAALEAARVTKLSFDGNDVLVERRVPADVRAQLELRGHELSVQGDYSSLMGGGQAVMRDASGVTHGASDPRKDGAAIPEPAVVPTPLV